MPPRRQVHPKPWTFLLIGGVLILVGLLLPAVALPSALADERAYRDAAPCAGGTPGRECLRRAEATVVDKQTVGTGDSKDHYVTLRFADGSRHRVELGPGNSHIEKVEAGDRVTTTSWRGELREFTVGTEQVLTSRYVVGRSKIPVMVALATLPLGAALVWAAYWHGRLRRTGRTPETAGRYHTSVPFTSALVFTVIVVIPMAGAPTLPVALAAAGGIAVAVLLPAVLVWHRSRRKAMQRIGADHFVPYPR